MSAQAASCCTMHAYAAHVTNDFSHSALLCGSVPLTALASACDVLHSKSLSHNSLLFGS